MEEVACAHERTTASLQVLVLRRAVGSGCKHGPARLTDQPAAQLCGDQAPGQGGGGRGDLLPNLTFR